MSLGEVVDLARIGPRSENKRVTRQTLAGLAATTFRVSRDFRASGRKPWVASSAVPQTARQPP
jgi:hypothetical protein